MYSQQEAVRLPSEFTERWAGSVTVKGGLGKVEMEERKGVKGLTLTEPLKYTLEAMGALL